MRPGQIQVFDGLRMTTEHINHLQGALHSGLQDLRLLVGPGRVVEGFEVELAEDSAVLIQPGLAFDHRGNRVVSDEPQRIQVSVPSNTDPVYLCARYKQEQTGKIEEYFTMLWDSCSFEFRTVPPIPDDNLVVLALCVKTSDGFEIHPPPKDKTDIADKEPAPAPAAAPPAVPSPSPAGQWHIYQGVVTLGSQTAQLLHASVSATEGEQRITLSEDSVELGFSPVSISLEVSLSLTLSRPVAPLAAGNTDVEQPQVWTCHSISHGEASFTISASLQSRLTRIPAYNDVPEAIEVSDDGVASLRVVLGTEGDLTLPNLSLLLQTHPLNGKGFKLVSFLIWKGESNEEHHPNLTYAWQAALTWKAFGSAVPS